MSWLPDEQWDFVKDSIDKKNVARSARHARTHCGKSGGVKLPCDFMSKKELKAMSGECIEYASLKKPMNFEEFKVLPNDLKREYILMLRNRFEAPDKYVAEMLGTSIKTFGLYIRDIGLGVGTGGGGGRRSWKKEEFYAWASGADMNATVAPVAEDEGESVEDAVVEVPSNTDIPESTESCCCTERVAATPTCGTLAFECNADQALNMLAMVLGTQKVRIRVEWDIMEGENV